MKRTIAVFAAGLAGTLCVLGCSRGRGTAEGCPSVDTTTPPIDEHIMAFLSAARAMHHEADIKEHAGDDDGAIEVLERLVSMRAPAATEADEVLADAYARLAELRLRKNDVPAADREIRSGLDHAAVTTYFRGHLLELEGIVEETRAALLVDAGETKEAAEARARAVSLLEEAIQVQGKVIARALGDGGEND